MKNKRLQVIADCVLDGCIMADIGTDHAYLPCELIQSGKALKCYACDIAEGPLSSAKATIEQFHYSDRIETILCPGLQKVPSDANVAVIAGMGWMTCKTILEDDLEKLEQFDQILIQVNRDVPYLRTWLMSHGYPIQLEKVIQDRLFYTVIGFSGKIKRNYTLTEEEIQFGPLLLADPDEDCLEYFRFIVQQNENILRKMESISEKSKALQWQNEILNKKLNHVDQ